MVSVDEREYFSGITESRGMDRLTPFSRTPATGKYGEVWHVAAEKFPDQQIVLQRPADIAPEGGCDHTFERWVRLVDETAAALHAAGVREWDRVVIMKANHPDVQVIGSAVARLGAIPVQLAWNHRAAVVTELLKRVERPYLVTDPGCLATAELDAPQLQALTRATIVIGAGSQRPEGTLDFDDLRGGATAPVRLREWTEPMVVTHTSGTTGPPKLALHSAQTLQSIAHVETERWFGFGFRGSDVWAYFDPYFHQHTLTALFTIATVGPKLVAISDVPDDGIADLLAAHPPTAVDMLPNMYLALEHLARDERELFARVRFYISSFDAVHTRSIRTFLGASKTRLPGWMQSWSQTENGSLILRPYVRSMVRKVGQLPPPTQSMGWPLPTVAKMRAIDPVTGVEVPRGEVGLIQIDQPGRCLSYLGEQSRHDAKVDGTWWHTGDLGIISRWGSVRLVDREVDRISSGISSIAIEDVLLDRLPEAAEVIVLSRQDRHPSPVYATYDNAEITERRWAEATEGLPELGEPTRIEWDQIPRTATWKVRRVELRERLFGESPAGTGQWT